MPSLSRHFNELKRRIEPEAARASKAQDMPTQVREHLKKHPDFATEEPHTRLAGSYARRTAIKSIKDVDILVFLDQSWRENTIDEVMTALYKALKDLPETLGDGETPTLRKQRRSVNVYLPESDLALDIVPVLKTTDSLDDMLEVPDRGWDEYVFTHPLGYGCLLSDLNDDHGGKVVPTIKMVKHWRDIQFQRMAPKSYWLESMVVRHIARGWVETKDRGDGAIIADLFDSIYERFEPVLDTEEETPFIPDAKLKNPVAWNWKRSAFKSFMNRLDESRKWARRAVDATDEAVAIGLWKKVFGDEWFPSTEELDEQCKQLGQLSAAGGLFVASTGRVSVERPTAVVSVPSPGKRFFGSK